MKIQESAENYLETILRLKRRLGHVRSIDIANAMQFTKPSISVAMKRLRENGYITMDRAGAIELTESGLAIADRIYERHLLLAEMLMALGVDEEIALQDACKMEHDLSEQTFQCMKSHYLGQKQKEN